MLITSHDIYKTLRYSNFDVNRLTNDERIKYFANLERDKNRKLRKKKAKKKNLYPSKKHKKKYKSRSKPKIIPQISINTKARKFKRSHSSPMSDISKKFFKHNDNDYKDKSENENEMKLKAVQDTIFEENEKLPILTANKIKPIQYKENIFRKNSASIKSPFHSHSNSKQMFTISPIEENSVNATSFSIPEPSKDSVMFLKMPSYTPITTPITTPEPSPSNIDPYLSVNQNSFSSLTRIPNHSSSIKTFVYPLMLIYTFVHLFVFLYFYNLYFIILYFEQ